MTGQKLYLYQKRQMENRRQQTSKRTHLNITKNCPNCLVFLHNIHLCVCQLIYNKLQRQRSDIGRKEMFLFTLKKKKTLAKLKSPLRLTGRPLNPFGTCRYFEKAKLCSKSVPVECIPPFCADPLVLSPNISLP